VFGIGTRIGVRGHSNSDPGVLGTSGTLTLPAGIQTIGVGAWAHQFVLPAMNNLSQTGCSCEHRAVLGEDLCQTQGEVPREHS
jgi:hypothetical protein